MTQRQANDIACIEYFIPNVLRHIEIHDKDKEMFLEYSERGLHKDKIVQWPRTDYDGFSVLCEGKRWRGIHIRMYEDGVMDMSMPYSEILESMPRCVVDFLKKEMFQGIDTDIIERYYSTL